MSAPFLENASDSLAAHAFSIGAPAAALLAGLMAGLLGSGHCAGMCGPIALAIGTSRRALAAYSFGRLVSYAGVGAAFGGLMGGLLGGFSDTMSEAARPRLWLSVAALAATSASLLWAGARAWRGRALPFSWRPLEKARSAAWHGLRAGRLPKASAAFFGGMMSAFLPCGHLYAFAAAAAASGGAVSGALLMASFWLGTLPMMGAAVFGLRRLLAPGLASGPKWAGALLIAAGLLSVGAFAHRLRHLAPSANASARAPDRALRCH